jgi:5-methylcytosine-specific restriction endonuclease McrA
MTRAEARAAGLKWYFTGRGCKYGHLANRLVSSAACYTCAKARFQRWRGKNLDRVKAARRAWARENPTQARGLKNHSLMLQRARLRGNLCACCQPQQLLIVYKIAALMGAEVDHVVPIAAGGLHCRKNLQLLSTEDHREKTKTDQRLIRSLELPWY